MGPDEVRSVEINNVIVDGLTNGHDRTPENELAETLQEPMYENGVKENMYFSPIRLSKISLQESSFKINCNMQINNDNKNDMLNDKIFNNHCDMMGDSKSMAFDEPIYTKERAIFDVHDDDDVNELKNNMLRGKFGAMKLKMDVYNKSDINHNGDVKKCDENNCGDEDSDNEKSESKSEVTLCASPMVVTAACRNAKSNETSTDTLVAENAIISR